MIDQNIKNKLITAQKSEITEYQIYKNLAKSTNSPQNQKILNTIANQEMKHYKTWKEYTKEDVKPNKWKLWKYRIISKIFGVTFALKSAEKNKREEMNYKEISKYVADAKEIKEEEFRQESELANKLVEDKIYYIDSIVLGLNDGLIEILGAICGFAIALKDTKVIAAVGLIMGLTAALSMGVSEYLSNKADNQQNPKKASVYAGGTFFITALFLVFPFLFITNTYIALLVTILNAFFVIFIINYYISTVKEISFKKRFSEMASLSLGIAAISFFVGYLIRIWLNVQI